MNRSDRTRSTPVKLMVSMMALANLASLAMAQEADYRLYDEIKDRQPIVGPLVGDVTDTTARIWAYAGPSQSPLALEIAEVGSKDPSDSHHQPFSAHVTQQPDAKKHHEAEFFVKGLRPETKYTFVVRKLEGQAVAPGEFTTAPAASGGAKFRMAVASCFGATYVRENGHTRPDNEYVTKSWNLLMDHEPDLQLIIGDNVYANSTNYNHLWDSHVLERVNNRPFAQAIRTIPTYAVWDDHDYGPNNSDGTAPGKEQSLRAFDEVFANPPRKGGGGPGIYTSFSWGGVDFFLLDGRYHRTPNEAPENETKDYLGQEQLRWLIDQLNESKAPFKLLVNGSTWMTSKDDSWRIFPHARQRLWQAIVANKINGVVFVSGDIHRCDLPLHYPEVEGAYFMPEITSSGLGSHGKNDRLAFVVVDFDTTAEDPIFTAQVIDGKDRVTMTRTVKASELKVGAADE